MDNNEQRLRVERLRRITQQQYDSLQQYVYRQLRNSSLQEDAFAHAMSVAVEHYDGRVTIQTYVTRVAHNWILNQMRHERPIADAVDIHDESGANFAPPSVAQPEVVEQVPQDMVDRLLGLLQDQHNIAVALSDTSLARRAEYAERLLVQLIENANTDSGAGIDEYEERRVTSRGVVTPRGTRALIEQHLAQELFDGSVETVGKTLSFLRGLIE